MFILTSQKKKNPSKRSVGERRLTAIAMAMADSVTVSMGEEMRGVFSVIFLVSAEVRSLKTHTHKQSVSFSLLQILILNFEIELFH